MDEKEVVGIETSGLSRDDCRCIDRLHCIEGDGSEQSVRASQAYFDLKNGDRYYVTADGQEHDLEPATKFNSRYVRALDEDSPEDPLLSLQSSADREAPRS